MKTLKGMGFILNPYDKCVTNKELNGKQCTVASYVDNNKLSHVQSKNVTEVLEAIKGHFGELEIRKGNEHNLDRKSRSVIISMRDQIEESIKVFGEDVDDTVASPTNKNLFTTCDGESDELGKDRSEIFHSVTAKLLFIMKRARPDIETTISYLMTRVSKVMRKIGKS